MVCFDPTGVLVEMYGTWDEYKGVGGDCGDVDFADFHRRMNTHAFLSVQNLCSSSDAAGYFFVEEAIMV